MKKRSVSGIKPTGRPHVGNYFGQMKQIIDMQGEYDSLAPIVDMHALITVQDANKLSGLSYELALDYLAIGLDPEQTILYKQSSVPEVTELNWIFNCITTVPYLQRAHAYKDAVAKDKEINVGLFDYPLLMAADILLYDADVVPVGQDQKQHVEYARDTAEKFNRIFGETFKLPEEKIIESVKTVPGTDGQKMSKSYNNTIPLFSTLDEIKKAVASIPTDSLPVADPKLEYENDNVFRLHQLFTVGDELEKVTDGYKNGGLSYKESKEILVKNIDVFIAPLRDKRQELAKNPKYVHKVLEEGAVKATKIAEAKMEEIRKKVGFGD